MIHCIIFRDSWQAVSSHVPTRGTTPLQDKSPNRVRCFNPRSREGNDQSRCGSIRFSAGFNPRSHEGNDSPDFQALLFRCCFNPRSHEGNDAKFDIRPLDADGFQSTFPRGERHAGEYSHGFYILRFNPRSHEGNDSILDDYYMPQMAFQSTFPRGERRFLFSCKLLLYSFNPRSHEGNDSFPYYPPKRKGRFNPRSHEGNDSVPEHFSPLSIVSIHVPTRGTTTNSQVTTIEEDKFQSTFPRGERRKL